MRQILWPQEAKQLHSHAYSNHLYNVTMYSQETNFLEPRCHISFFFWMGLEEFANLDGRIPVDQERDFWGASGEILLAEFSHELFLIFGSIGNVYNLLLLCFSG